MTKNDTFKKKVLCKKDYAAKEKGAKAVKGVAGALGLVVIVPKLVKDTINMAKKFIFRV